ncbi:hypothetical protein [Campylobacter volucris]|nr:hypothetical protein [Campylobacter volucris]
MKKILALCIFSSFLFANDIVINNPYVKQTPPNAKATAFFFRNSKQI